MESSYSPILKTTKKEVTNVTSFLVKFGYCSLGSKSLSIILKITGNLLGNFKNLAFLIGFFLRIFCILDENSRKLNRELAGKLITIFIKL